MKVLHVIIGLGTGGAELMLKRLVLGESNGSVEHVVISLTDLGAIGPDLVNHGVEVFCVGLGSVRDVPSGFFRLLRYMKCARPDIVQTWMYHADLIGGMAARLIGIKSIIWGIRTTRLSDRGSFATVLIRWICARLSWFLPAQIVCAADASRRFHIQLGYCGERMVVVPNGVDLDCFPERRRGLGLLRQELRLPADQFLIGCLGRFSPEKDFSTFIEAAGMVAKHIPNARFVMIGRGLDGANRDLCQWIETAGLSGRVLLLGERRDVATCLSMLDLFVLSSTTEGFPNGLAEAMATGLPCVATDAGDARFLLGDCGFVVKTESPELLADGIRRMHGLSGEARCQLGRAARARVTAEFSMAGCSRKYHSIYSNLLVAKV